LRERVLGSGIIRRPLNRAEAALPGETALELGADFVGAPFLQWISAAARECEQSEQ
jgi:hypothetical protein